MCLKRMRGVALRRTEEFVFSMQRMRLAFSWRYLCGVAMVMISSSRAWCLHRPSDMNSDHVVDIQKQAKPVALSCFPAHTTNPVFQFCSVDRVAF
jgi:hypothetical protein